VIGAIAFIAATLTRVAGIISLLASLCLWLALAVALYLPCIKIGLLRTCTPVQSASGSKQHVETPQT